MELKLLIVEDDRLLAEAVSDYFTGKGWKTDVVYDGETAVETAERKSYQMILLDVMLPGRDGFSVCRKIREMTGTPVFFITARVMEEDELNGYAVGADDYITKPFTPMELLARVNSQLRRYAKFLSLKEHQSEDEQVYTVGGLELNNDTKEVSLDGNPVRLTPIEFRILQLLMKNPGRVYSAEEIYERVWNEEAIATDTVMVHIRNIREKIEIDPRNPRYLKVVWGVGYKIEKG